MSRKSDRLGEKLDKLAENIVDAVLGEPVDGEDTHVVSLDNRIEAMKIIGNYHIGRLKAMGRMPDEDDEDDVTDFKKFGEKLKAVS